MQCRLSRLSWAIKRQGTGEGGLPFSRNCADTHTRGTRDGRPLKLGSTARQKGQCRGQKKKLKIEELLWNKRNGQQTCVGRVVFHIHWFKWLMVSGISAHAAPWQLSHLTRQLSQCVQNNCALLTQKSALKPQCRRSAMTQGSPNNHALTTIKGHYQTGFSSLSLPLLCFRRYRSLRVHAELIIREGKNIHHS